MTGTKAEQNKVADTARVGYTIGILMQNENADVVRYADGGTRHEYAHRMSGFGRRACT